MKHCWSLTLIFSTVSWDYRIHQLHLCKGVRTTPTHPPNECPGYTNKKSDSEAPIMLELWGM